MKTFPSDEELLRRLLDVSLELSDTLHELEASGVDLNEQQDSRWHKATDVIELIREKRKSREYLVRHDDFMIFKSNGKGLYAPLNSVKEYHGNETPYYGHFTYNNLTNLGFFAIKKDEIDTYQKKCDDYYEQLSEQTRKKGIK